MTLQEIQKIALRQQGMLQCFELVMAKPIKLAGQMAGSINSQHF